MRKRRDERHRPAFSMLPLGVLIRGAIATAVGAAVALAEAQPSRPRETGREDEAQGRSGPRLAKPGADKPEGGIKGLAKALKNGFQEHDLGVMAAALAYRFFLALFPFFIFLAALSGLVAGLLNIEDPTGQIIGLMEQALPAETAELVGGQIGQVVTSQNPGLLSIGIIGAIWAAASGIQGLMKATNVAYEVPETRKWWKKYGISIGLTIVSGLFVVLATVLLFTGQFFAMDIVEGMGLNAGWLATVVAWLRWPLIIALLIAGVAFLYWASPNMQLPFKIITPGAVAFVVVWLLATVAFSFYVANFGNYNATYGALGAVVVLLVWLYITNLLLLLGAEINAFVDERSEPELVAQRRGDKQEAAALGKST